MTQPAQPSTAAVSTIVQPISVPVPDSPAAAPSRDSTQDALEAENLIETYQIIGEWVRFADAKAAAVLAVNGALCGALIPLLKRIHEKRSATPYNVVGSTGVHSVPVVAGCDGLLVRVLVPMHFAVPSTWCAPSDWSR
jgi:hypothetical protein